MSDTAAKYEVHGDVAVIRLSNPPVNGLSFHLREGLSAGLDRALADAAIRAVVLIGAEAYFSCGADIREFNTPAGSREPTTPGLINRLGDYAKPVIAAIHGAALGGGLELALGCHYRVVQHDANIALPEVKLGLLPGGGGTQRLPRLIGVEAALDMIATGRTIKGDKAFKLGLADAMSAAGQDLLETARAFAKTIFDTPLSTRRLPERAALPDNASELFAAARAKAAKEMRGLIAPQECIACVEQSTLGTLAEGLRFERERFKVLVEGVESKAMRHLFFAEREAAKVDYRGEKPVERKVDVIGVIGAGTMGGGIAMAFANAGYPVKLIEATQAQLDRGMGIISKNYAGSVSKGKMSEAEMQARLGRIEASTDYAILANADFIIEAVFEEMDVKRIVFEQIDRAAKPGAILATNTSRLDINEIARMTLRPQDVIGTHFFSPANIMRLVEVVRGDVTAADVIHTSMKLVKKINKVAALVGVCDGFVGNRMVSHYTREAHFLLEEGASPADVDKTLEAFGMAMGPCRMGDLAGMDISWAFRKRLAPTRPKNLRYCHIADRICESGRYGQKSGSGFYRYEAGSRTPLPEPLTEQIILDCARESGITRRTISKEEIIERTMYALVNEAAKILEEGIAQRGSDIDLIYVNGYSFPSSRGGPLFYADTVGLPKVLERIEAFHLEHGEFWTPAPLLVRLAKEGGRLSAYEVKPAV